LVVIVVATANRRKGQATAENLTVEAANGITEAQKSQARFTP
jgi:hypothetical protein